MSRRIVNRGISAVEGYVCPSCALSRPNGFRNSVIDYVRPRSTVTSRSGSSKHTSTRPRATQRFSRVADLGQWRGVATVASATTIHAPTTVPVRLRELHAALKELEKDASSYVNLSRIQLALRGLESRDAVIRVAILALGDTKQAKRLLRLVLADPLADREEEWERSLENTAEGALSVSPSTLYTHGTEDALTQQSPSNRLLPTIRIPARTLDQHKIEILLSSINLGDTIDAATAAESSSRIEEAVLVPALDTQTSSSGRFTQVTYPVHKAILLGDGLDSVLQLGKYFGSVSAEELRNGSIQLAVQAPASGDVAALVQNPLVATVDTEVASKALATFRESIANSVAYERGWLRSGMPLLSEWLLKGTTARDADTPKEAVTSLIRSLTSEAKRRIDLEARQEDEARRSSAAVSNNTRDSISAAISTWAEQAHAELRDRLDYAFAGRHWRKLSWWKLLWRVDDVSMVGTEILEKRWLVDAEKGVIFLAGRLEEAGLGHIVNSGRPSQAMRTTLASSAAIPIPAPRAKEEAIFLETPPSPDIRDLIADDTKSIDDGSAIRPSTSTPWPTTISSTRHTLLQTRIPALQSLAQKLVFQTLSTNVLASSIAALAYLNISTTTVYETGAIAALGLAFSLRKVQGDWEAAREKFEVEMREDGRRALKETEGVIRGIVVSADASKMAAEDESMMAGDRRNASNAIERVERALSEIEDGSVSTRRQIN